MGEMGLRKWEEALPRLKEWEGIEESIENVQSKDRCMIDGLQKKRGACEFLEGGAEWKMAQQACTTMFFLMPQNVTSERPIALMPTLIRFFWEAFESTRSGKVAAEVSS